MFDRITEGDPDASRPAPGQPVIGGLLRALLAPIMALAVAGFVASLAVHLVSWFAPVPGWVMGLHVAIFVVWLPTVLVMRPLAADYPQKDMWRAALRGAPRWMHVGIKVTVAYAVVNFASFVFFDLRSGAEPSRGFSGHWMVFYGIAAVVLYSALHAVDERRLCPRGHACSRTAEFCERCGAALGPPQRSLTR